MAVMNTFGSDRYKAGFHLYFYSGGNETKAALVQNSLFSIYYLLRNKRKKIVFRRANLQNYDIAEDTVSITFTNVNTHFFLTKYRGKTQNYLAELFSSQRNPIIVFSLDFFQMSLDKQIHTVIHEISHAAIGTADFAYGDAECKRLAANKDPRSFYNADTYALFVDNLTQSPIV